MKEMIESLRNKMIHIAIEKGNLGAPEVLAISQELDVLLVYEQKQRSNSK